MGSRATSSAARAARTEPAGRRVFLCPERRTYVSERRSAREPARTRGAYPALTDELRAEGIANEINRHVQELRKEAGYAVSDRIELEIVGPLDEAWKSSIARSALATLTPVDEPDRETEFTVNDDRYGIRVRRTTGLT